MPTCFVIQPFDGGNFDNRYEDVFAPAIKDAGFDPYRVDRDPAVSIPIEDIQSGIKQAAVCLADITLDNPNVWFELGYALSAGKSVVMVCGVERKKFPFDVHHRSIIKYQTGSPRDFDALQSSIKERLEAIDKKDLALDELVRENPLVEVGGYRHSSGSFSLRLLEIRLEPRALYRST